MNVSKNMTMQALPASLSSKNTSETASSSSDFSATLSKLFSPHSQSSSSTPDSGSGNSSKRNKSQNQDASTPASPSSTGAKDSQYVASQQQPAVSMSMVAIPTSIQFDSQPATEPTSGISTAATTDLTSSSDLSSATGNNSTPVTNQPNLMLNVISSSTNQPENMAAMGSTGTAIDTDDGTAILNESHSNPANMDLASASSTNTEPSQDDTTAPVLTQPVLPQLPVNANDSDAVPSVGPDNGLPQNPMFTKKSDVTAAGALAAIPVHSGPTPIAPVKATTPTDGHNQLATPHQPVALNPVSTTSPVVQTGHINNGLITAPTSKPTGPGHLDDKTTAAAANQNVSAQTPTDSSVVTPVSAIGDASDSNTGSQGDSNSSDGKDRMKDDAVSAIAATAVQASVMQTMPATVHTQGAPASTPMTTEISAPVTAAATNASSARSTELEAASVSDTKSVISTSKLMQTFNQSEMRVGMRSAEFGDISIRAQATHDSILTQISVDHPELASSLAAHIPDMQSRLASVGNHEVHINTTQAHSASSSTTTDTGGSSQGGRQPDQGSRSSFSTSYSGASYMDSAVPSAAMANTLQNAGYDGRLDLQA